MNLTRRNLLAAGFTALGGGAVYARYVEPSMLTVSETHVTIGLAKPIRLLHLSASAHDVSDLHYSSEAPLHFIERAIRIGLTLRPDLICLTGDYATHSSDFHPKPYPAVLRLLSDAAPVYATFRNHDGGLWARDANSFAGCSAIRDLLEKSGAKVIHNAKRGVRWTALTRRRRRPVGR